VVRTPEQRGPVRSLVQLVAVTCVVAATGACGSGDDPGPARAEGGRPLPVVVDGLDRPTQFVPLDDGSFVVAQLAGAEGDGTGEVLLVRPDGEREVLLDGLDVPTGVAVTADAIWVAQATSLDRAEWSGPGGPVGALRPVVSGLPNNGRSQGSLTVTPDGRVLFATTGTLVGGAPAPRSATLWSVPVSDLQQEPTAVAVGAKNAYATAVDGGDLLVTEIGDARVPPPDLLVRFPVPSPTGGGAPVDLGWPSCRPVGPCPGVVEPIARFAPGSTPTGVVADGDGVLVALFVEGRVVSVPAGGGAAATVADGLRGPHSLVRSVDGAVLLSEHEAGRIVRLPG